ncbi:MAG: ATP-binding protein [Deltaproteobacteria bacterium]|nr:ATP-binding protein [Deltaproteobacteria bacterium]
MLEGVENPYRRDRVADALFVGREALLAELAGAVRAGRNAIRAVMGGRGMGKSSLARQLQKSLGTDALTIIASGSVQRTAAEIGRALGVSLDTGDPVETLVGGVAARPTRRVALVLDEVERLLRDGDGLALLDNLREAYEHSQGRLAVLVLGGTEIRDLLVDQASPFLRIAGGVHTLTGLTRDETATLLRAPLCLDVSDEVVDAVWAETAGHPWLLQAFMEFAVERALSRTEVVAQLPAAMRAAESQVLHPVAFPIWWDNLRVRGQDAYRRLAREPAPVPSAAWVARFGDDPRPWLDVLASTGVAALDEGTVIARGALFRRWVADNHPEAPTVVAPDDALGAWLTVVGVDAFERLVVRAIAAWARAMVEFPAAAVRSGPDVKSDNSALQPEAFFQMHAIVALLQHERELTAEPEALSMKVAGRTDIKVRSRHDTTRRACVEFKIFGRKDEEVVKQVVGYAAPGDSFAAIVSVDRCRRLLRPEYDSRCFRDAVPDRHQDAPAPLLYPAYCTNHLRAGANPLRVWHFLVQLRDA